MSNLFSYTKMRGKNSPSLIFPWVSANKVVISKKKLYILGRSKGEEVGPSYLNKEQQDFECIACCLKHPEKL